MDLFEYNIVLNYFILTMLLCGILCRYSTVLESVVTCTEDLAYKQAKEADDLLEQGKYLGMRQSPWNSKLAIRVLSFLYTIENRCACQD
jgi:hypothetical protein